MKKNLIVSSIVLTVLILSLTTVSATSTQSYFRFKVKPLAYQVPNFSPATVPYCRGATPFLTCYPPSFLKKAYNFPTAAGAQGQGQTIVIVDAFLSPTIKTDLATFDSLFGLPAPPSFKVVCPQGCTPFNPSSGNEVGWAIEMSLDVEWAHAAAPKANIVLVSSTSDMDIALNAAENSIITNPAYAGSTISQSFGEPEYALYPEVPPTVVDGETNYALAMLQGITVLASAGDWGASFYSTLASASWPASSPLVLAVGGTEGNPYLSITAAHSCAASATCNTGLVMINGGASGCSSTFGGLTTTCIPTGYGGEQVWNEYTFIDAATGGAPSLLWGRPSWQFGTGVPTTGLGSTTQLCSGSPCRLVSDVSLDASVNGGVLVVTSFSGPAVYIVGGTSVSSPIWAGIIALAKQKYKATTGLNAGFVNAAIYALARSSNYGAAFHDITIGNNILPPPPTAPGFTANTGWDFPTGWGTPNVAVFVTDIQPYLS